MKIHIPPPPFNEWALAVVLKMRELYRINNDIGERKVAPEQLKEAHAQAVHAALQAWLVLKFQEVQSKLQKLMEAILKGEIYFHQIIDHTEEMLKEFDPHRFGEAFEVRDDIVFTDKRFTRLSNFLSDLSKMAQQSWAEIADLSEQNATRASRTDKKSDLEEHIEFEDRIEDARIKSRREIYEFLRQCPDFMHEQPKKEASLG